MFTRLTALLALLTLCTACYDEPGWPTIHGDSRNSDTTEVDGYTQLKRLWGLSFPGAAAAAATIDSQGRAYFTTTGDGTPGACHLFAIDIATGTEVWCSSEVNRWAVGSSVVIDFEGNLYVGDDEAMHSFDRDGNLRWDTPTVGAAISAQFLKNGRLIFVTHIGQVMVLKRSNGNVLLPVYELVPGATYTLGTGLTDCLFGGPTCPSANTLAVDFESGRIYNTVRQPSAAVAALYALQYDFDTHTISQLWVNDALTGGTASSPVISPDGSRVYVNDNGGNYHALDALTGASIWDVNIGYAPGGSPSVTANGRGIPAGLAGSTTLAVQDLGSTGSIIWNRLALENIGVVVQTANDIAYVAVRVPNTQFNIDIVSLDATSGFEYDRVRMTPIPGATVGTSIAADGTILVAGLNGALVAFGEDTGP